MKIVVLDGFALNPGDLSWEELAVLGELKVYDRTGGEETLERIGGAEIVFTNKTILSADILQKLPAVKYIGVMATGYDVVDITSAREMGIPVTNVPTYGTDSVAQMVFAHILNLTQRVADHSRSVMAGDWCRCPDYSYSNYSLIELAGLTLGIVGLGRIGKAVGRIGQAFAMKVIAHDPTVTLNIPAGVNMVDQKELFKNSDIVSLHCPLISQTRKLINQERLSLMKKSAFLINTSRGPLVDEAALAHALNTGQIAGAALDVLSAEPPTKDNPLFKAKNVFITPHNAWATRSARARLLKTAIENLIAFLKGKSQNVVN